MLKPTKPIKPTKLTKPAKVSKNTKVKRGGVVTKDNLKQQKNRHNLLESGPRYVFDTDENSYVVDAISFSKIPIDRSILLDNRVYDVLHIYKWLHSGYHTLPHTNKPISDRDKNRIEKKYYKVIGLQGPFLRLRDGKIYNAIELHKYIDDYVMHLRNKYTFRGDESANGWIPYPEAYEENASDIGIIAKPPYNIHGSPSLSWVNYMITSAQNKFYFNDQELNAIGRIGYSSSKNPRIHKSPHPIDLSSYSNTRDWSY
jgi:hypothetical protein